MVFDLGYLPHYVNASALGSAPGEYKLCWHPANQNDVGFIVKLGVAKVVCPAGYYTLPGGGGRAQCILCTKGFYCIGLVVSLGSSSG